MGRKPILNLRLRVMPLVLVVTALAFLMSPAAVSPFAPQAALACNEPPANHCWGVDRWTNTPTYGGGIAYINTTNLSVGDSCTQFANSEMWVGTNYDPSPSGSSGGWWIEEGVRKGLNCGAGPWWFWAEEQGNPSGLRFHLDVPVSLSTTYIAKIDYTGGNSWEIVRGSTVIATQGATPCCTKFLQAGGELDTNSAYVYGEANGLQKKLNGSWNYDWAGGLVADGSWSTTWYTTGKDLIYSFCCVH
jgi:hypothetical protein